MKICFQYAGHGTFSPSPPEEPPTRERTTREPKDALLRSKKRAKLLRLAVLAAVSTSLLACGDDTASGPLRTDTPAEEPAPAAESPAGKRRTLTTSAALPTSPVNLLTDPGFQLLGFEQGFGSFLSFYSDGDFIELTTRTDSRSPAGFTGRVADVRDLGATDGSSRPITLLASFGGGDGPFSASVWVSKSDAKGAPTAIPTDKAALTITVSGGGPGAAQAFDLAPEPSSLRVVAGRTWIRYRAEITEAIPRGGFFMIETGSTGGQWHVAAPELVPGKLVQGLAARRAPLSPARARPVTARERAAAKRYASIPPRLVPATAAAGSPSR